MNFLCIFMIIIAIIFIKSEHHRNVINDNSTIRLRINKLIKNRNKSILVHIHIPKAGGTALALALTTNCQCHLEHIKASICDHCLQVIQDHNHYTYSITRLTGN